MSRHTQLPEFINSENDLSAATDGRGVMHKERGEEKGKSPHTPLKEKEGQKEISPVPAPVLRAGARTRTQGEPLGSGSGTGSVDVLNTSVEIRPRVTIHVNDEFVRYSDCDSVEMAMSILRLPQISTVKGISYNNPRIMRKLRNEIGDATFREVLIQQWHENASDGEPRSRTAAFMAKLFALRQEIRNMKGGAA